MKYIVAIASIFFLPLSALPSPTLTVFESLSSIPEGWFQGNATPEWYQLNLRLAVHQPRAAEFEQRVIDISTPGKASYGQFLSREELKASLRPHADVTGAIIEWLSEANIPAENIRDDGDWINFNVTVYQAEKLLDTQFYWYHRLEDPGRSIIRTLQYSIPTVLHEHVQMIQPTTRFGTPQPQGTWIRGGQEIENMIMPKGYDAVFCNHTVTPGCLRGLYGLGDFVGDPHLGNKLGISGYLEEYAQYADLGFFYDMFTNYSSPDNFSVVSINGGVNTQSDGLESGEANLDVQYGLSLAHGTPSTYYTTGGRGPLVPDLDQPVWPGTNEPYLDQLHYLLSLDDCELPTVLTTSYGEDEQSIPGTYTNATCSLFAQLGARGVSVIFSSGDTGVGSACQTNDGKNTTRFLPTFPASCPFVTSVGGTYHVEPERAAPFSSGGFSDRFPRPSYQDDAVETYLKQLGTQWDGLYNSAGRGFPDVAAQSVNFSVYDQGLVKRYEGTSCASPTFAAIVADLNSIRMGAGFKPLGFLNPWLYGHGYKGLTDIVDGGSTGCTGFDRFSFEITPRVPGASWNATEGWDPVTGLGTPNFPKLVEMMFIFDQPQPGNNMTVPKVGARAIGRPRFGAAGWRARK